MRVSTPESAKPPSVPNHLASIDRLLRQIEEEKRNLVQRDHLFRHLCEDILRHEGVSASQWIANPVKACFASELPLPAKRFAAACFLRLLAADSGVFEDTVLSAGLHKLLEAA